MFAAAPLASASVLPSASRSRARQRVALVGGAGEALRPYLEPEIAALLTSPLQDAADGAILLVGGLIAPQRQAAQ